MIKKKIKKHPKILMLIVTIAVLIVLLNLWADELAQKQMGFLSYKYETIKIILHSLTAYAIAGFLNKKFLLSEKIKSIPPNTIFLVTFLILNAYIICQYTSKVVDHRIINSKIRASVNLKTKKLGPAGWGFEADAMSYEEFRELTKDTKLPAIPDIAENIFVYDWYEFDYRRKIEFDVKPDFNLPEFYQNDSLILNDVKKVYYHHDEKNAQLIRLDTTKIMRYKWEISDN